MYVFVKTDGLDFLLPLSRAGTICNHVKHLHFLLAVKGLVNLEARLMVGEKSMLQKL